MYKFKFQLVLQYCACVCVKTDNNRDKAKMTNVNNCCILEDIWIPITLIEFFSIQYFKVFIIKIWREVEA